MASFTIPARFNGPPHSANGGYACGCVAEFLGRPAQIRLQSPPPLDEQIGVAIADDTARATHGGSEVAIGRAASIVWTAPRAPSATAARAARSRFTGLDNHYFPTCFVCGPGRTDGLRLFPGPVDGRDLVACDWSPPDEFAVDGAIDPKIVWAALDCPSFFGTGVPYDQHFLLGQMTGDVPSEIPADRRYIVYGWSRGAKGRKYFTGAALADDQGHIWATAEHIWLRIFQ